MESFLGALAFLYGLVFGSFLNVCIYRLPRGLSVVTPRSACPECGAQIAAYDNVPVLSWLLLRGRCRHCHTRITPRYAIVELLTGMLFLACFFKVAAAPFSVEDAVLYFLKFSVFCFLVLGLIFTDAETQLLPDKLTFPGIALGFIFSFFAPMRDLLTFVIAGMLPIPIPPAAMTTAWSVISSVIGALVGAGFIYGISVLWRVLRGYEGMGFGDVKLMAMAGAFLGATRVLVVMFSASILGSLLGVVMLLFIYRKRRARYVRVLGPVAGRKRARESAFSAYRFLPLPFGVPLGIMSLVTLFFGDPFLRWYLGAA